MIKVKVRYPIVQHDTVSFAWHSDKRIPFLKQESFYIKYEGINIQSLRVEVFWQVFLSTMVPVFNLSEEKIQLIFPRSIPTALAETWINYNSASNVVITPLSNATAVKPEIGKSKTGKTKVGLLFGGGKDSTCALSMLSEIYGMDNMVLISYVAPLIRGSLGERDQRREQLLLEPLRKELNVKVQKVITNLRTIMIDVKTAKSMHIALFMGPALPIILHYNLNILTFSYEFNAYYTNYHDSPTMKFNYMRSRPEFCSYIAERTNKLFGTAFILIDPNYSFSSMAAFKILAERYPHMLKHILMCETIGDPNTKWCSNCKKCATAALYCLRYLKNESFVDLDWVLTENEYIKQALRPDGKLLNVLSNIVAEMDPLYVKEKLNENAYRNFIILREKYGHLKNECFEGFILSAFEKQNLPEPLAGRLKSIITQHCPTITEVKPFIYGGKKVDINYNISSEIPDVFCQNIGR